MYYWIQKKRNTKLTFGPFLRAACQIKVSWSSTLDTKILEPICTFLSASIKVFFVRLKTKGKCASRPLVSYGWFTVWLLISIEQKLISSQDQSDFTGKPLFIFIFFYGYCCWFCCLSDSGSKYLPRQYGGLRGVQPNSKQVIVSLPLISYPSLHSNTKVAPWKNSGSEDEILPFGSFPLRYFKGWVHLIPAKLDENIVYCSMT